MITTTHRCSKCESTNLVLNGKNKSGTPTYHCKDCNAYRVLYKKKAVDKEAVFRTFEERNSYRSTGRIFGISHVSIFNWLKKKAQNLNPFKTTVQEATPDTVLEVDEIFSYILLKTNQIRIWIVENKQTKQIVSFHIGDGTMESCKRLWRKLPYSYLRCTSFSDFWASYNCLPEETHTKVDKETGLTNHVERLNNTIRQRFSRFVRKTLSFSKKLYMLNLHFKLWAFQYNLNLIS